MKYTFVAVADNNGWAKHPRLIAAVKNAASHGMSSRQSGIDVQVWYGPIDTQISEIDGSIHWDCPEWPVLVGLFRVVGGGRVVDADTDQSEMMEKFWSRIEVRKAQT